MEWEITKLALEGYIHERRSRGRAKKKMVGHSRTWNQSAWWNYKDCTRHSNLEKDARIALVDQWHLQLFLMKDGEILVSVILCFLSIAESSVFSTEVKSKWITLIYNLVDCCAIDVLFGVTGRLCGQCFSRSVLYTHGSWWSRCV